MTKKLQSMVKLVAVCALIGVLAGCAGRNRSSVTQDRVPGQPQDTWGPNYAGEVPPAVAAITPSAPKPAEPDCCPDGKQPPAPIPREIPRATSECGPSEIRTSLIHAAKRTPSEVVLGEEFSYDIVVTALEEVGNVVAIDTLPKGAAFVRSEPPAQVSGEQIAWRIPEIRKGQAATIRVTLRAQQEGVFCSCFTVSADPRACTEIRVGRPLLEITKTGPATSRIGGDCAYNITVSNRGTSVARGVVVTDAVPNGMSHSSGQSSLSFNLGDLAPGESKSVPVNFTAKQRGRLCNVAVASSSNAGRVQAEACTVVTEPRLEVAKTGIKEQFTNKKAEYTIVVANTGDVPLNNVIVTDNAPPNTSIVAAPGASVSGNQAVWQISQMQPGEKKSFNVLLTTSIAGEHCNSVTVATAEGLTGESRACTVWKGYAGLLLEMIDTVDPIQVGEMTDYVITITNQGTADDTNITTVMQFPAEVQPLSASGDTAGRVEGQTVTFAPFPRLAPKQAIRWTIRAKGVAPGDARTKCYYTSDLIKPAVAKEESTHVY
jgi:uncharacterized repeat protein (TIGR01451 family)